MKKKILIATLLLEASLVSSCTFGGQNIPKGETYTLPNLYGMTLREAKLECGSNVLFDDIDVESSELIEGQILSYHNHAVGDTIEKGSRVTVKVAKRLDGSKSYPESSIIDYSNCLYKLTGPDSVNEDLCSSVGVGGCDLGIPFELPDGKTMLLYGDTFSGQNMQGRWHSNYMAITSDYDLYDDLIFDDIVHNDQSNEMIPFMEGKHQGDNETDKSVEVTKIPTGGISIGNNVYIFYMSIRYWGVSGSWLVTYNQCCKANDSTYKSWTDVPSLKWTDDEFYYGGQIYPFTDPKDPAHIYFTSIPGGRNDGAVMFRVAKDKFENRDEYEYLTASNNWVKGDKGMSSLNKNPYYIVSPGVSEPSIAYNEYLDKYVYVTLKGSSISMICSDNIYGPYNQTYSICTQSDYPGLYGGFIYPKFMTDNGQRFYIQLSRWTPIYNTFIVEVILK